MGTHAHTFGLIARGYECQGLSVLEAKNSSTLSDRAAYLFFTLIMLAVL